MLKLNNREIGVPEDGDGRYFRYRHRETGHWSVGFDWFTWQERIRTHRQSNNLSPVSVEETEDQLCRTLPPGWCKQDKTNAPAAGLLPRFGWAQVVAAMKAFAKVAFTGFVDQAEANRRAAICSACYFNVNPSGCGSCQKLASLVTGELARRKTSYDANLKACAVCQCALRALVHFPLNLLDIEQKQEQLPDFCWQKAA